MAGNQLVVVGEPSPQFQEMEVIEQPELPGKAAPLTETLRPLTLGVPREIVGLPQEEGGVVEG